MLHSEELIFALAIVNVPMARLRLFAPLLRRYACWRLGHRSTIRSVVVIAVWLRLFPRLVLRVYLLLARRLCCANWDSGICDRHHALEPLPLNQSLTQTRAIPFTRHMPSPYAPDPIFGICVQAGW
jgi:hypothetical protein